VLPQLRELSLSCPCNAEGARMLAKFSAVTKLTSLTLETLPDPDRNEYYGYASVQQRGLRVAATQHFYKVLHDFIAGCRYCSICLSLL
jgi:hypothetical protein